MDRWQTYSVLAEGGLVENLSPTIQGEQFPGSLIDARNFEPSSVGGYRRIKGYSKYDSLQPTGASNAIQGVIEYNTGCIAVSDDKVYFSTGSGWTLLHTYTNPCEKILFTKYSWGIVDEVIIVDGANEPLYYDGTTLVPMVSGATIKGNTLSASSASNIFAAKAVQEFHNHMFFLVDSAVRFSGPNDETLVDGTGGSGEFVTGSQNIGVAPWRENLYLFSSDRIGKITGQNSSNFQYDNVTHKVGVVDPRTIQEMNGDVYYTSFDGVRTIAGTDRNDDVELASVTRGIPDTIETLPLTVSGKDIHAVVSRQKSQYRLFTGDALSEDEEGIGLLGGLRLKANGSLNLEWFPMRGINPSCSDSGLRGNEEYVLHGGYDGYVYRQEQGNNFDGRDIGAFLRFPFWTLGDSELRKILYKAKIYIDSDSSVDPELSWILDYNEVSNIQPDVISLGTGEPGFAKYGSGIYGQNIYGDDFPTTAEVNLVGSGKNVSFAFSSNDTESEYSVQSMTIQYGLAERR